MPLQSPHRLLLPDGCGKKGKQELKGVPSSLWGLSAVPVTGEGGDGVLLMVFTGAALGAEAVLRTSPLSHPGEDRKYMRLAGL